MDELPMPSDIRAQAPANAQTPVVEPPSAKLIVRLFLIPFTIVALAVGIVYVISLMAGRQPSFSEAISGLKTSGGGRTAEVLVGPGAKQRYLYAKTLTDKMKLGMSPADRIQISDELIDVLRHYTRSGEGEVQHFVLLAIGRAWQIDPTKPHEDTDETKAARQKAADALVEYATGKEIASRKAALLAMAYFKGRTDSVRQFIPVLSSAVRSENEDLDVRMCAATALGPLGDPSDQEVIDALHVALRDSDPQNIELVWQSALSLAQLDRPEVADTIVKLLTREELAAATIYDRETDPKNPTPRKLSEREQERILINTMIGVEHYKVPIVQQRLKVISETDPSARVRAALKSNAPRDAISRP